VGSAPDGALFAQLVAAWDEPHRRYHTRTHLQECLAALELARPLAAHPGEVELAVWFHDAVYDVRGHDSEARSAAWARDEARAVGAAPGVAERLHALVMATRHDTAPATADAQLLVDVDLSILGAPAERFAEYERQVREEYAWVPEPEFRERRRVILAAFLARPALYGTEPFRRALEARARENLRRSIAELGGGAA